MREREETKKKHEKYCNLTAKSQKKKCIQIPPKTHSRSGGQHGIHGCFEEK